MIFILLQLIVIAIFFLVQRLKYLVNDNNSYMELIRENATKNQNLNPFD
jgi:hypothetical protein